MDAQEKNRFENMEERLSTIENKISTVHEKLDQVLIVLSGDNLGTFSGLIKEFNDLKVRVKKVERFYHRLTWTAIGAGIGIGFSISKLVQFIQDAAK